MALIWAGGGLGSSRPLGSAMVPFPFCPLVFSSEDAELEYDTARGACSDTQSPASLCYLCDFDPLCVLGG